MGQLQITPEGYAEIKNTIKAKLNETANNFIIIGYYLKQVRDNMLYINDGYHNMEEFAQGEYRFSASTASRFMDINTKFSEGGNSLEIKQEYRNFGYSKLQEMLTVKEEDMELITPDTTVKQIREIKAVEKAEDKAAKEEAEQSMPIVQMAQGQQEEQEQVEVATSQHSPLEETLIALWKAKPEELLSKVLNNMITAKDLAEELCPSGSRTFNYGIYMLFLYDYNMGLKFRYYANGKPNVEPYTYEDIIQITKQIITEDVFKEITAPAKAEEPAVSETVPEKKEWEAPELKEKQVTEEHDNAEQKTADESETYKPLPGQTKIEDIPELQADNTMAAAESAIDAEYREIDQEADAQEKDSDKYSDVEIQNAVNFFEVEYYRMVGTGLKESAKCRNYRIALEAIKECYVPKSGI